MHQTQKKRCAGLFRTGRRAYSSQAIGAYRLSAYCLCATFAAFACEPMDHGFAYGAYAYLPLTAAQPKAIGTDFFAYRVSLS